MSNILDIKLVSFSYVCLFLIILLADCNMNVTYINLSGHVELEKYRYVYFSIMVIAYILILSSNFTVVCLVVIHKSLHEPMYIFIAALLINSILFSSSIYPKLLIDFLSEKQIVSYEACLIQAFTFYTLSCSEYLLLAAMAFDRFVSISRPLQYHMIMRKRTVSVFLVLAWFVPACHIVVPFIGNANSKLCSFTLRGIFCNNSVHYLFCVASRALLTYGLVALFNIAVFPMVFILFTYTVILIVAYRSCGDVRKKAAQTCLPHLLVLINYSCLFAYDIIIVRLESDISKAVRFVMTMCIIMCSPLFNPVIYGLKMKEIYKHLRRLFSQTRGK